MNKIIDLDRLFQSYMMKYIRENKGKLKESEFEERIPALYEKFGKASLKELDGLTPETYYSSFSGEELVQILKNYIESKTSVSDFLCEAIIRTPSAEKPLFELLENSLNEEIIMYAMNLLKDIDSEMPLEKYVDFILDSAKSQNIKDLATEILCDQAEKVKENILNKYNTADNTGKEYFVEILSRCGLDDRIYKILILAYTENFDNIPLYADYLARYGDERALPILLKEIERSDLKYVEYTELKYAIEKLGGDFNDARDFSDDESYKFINEHSKGAKII